MGTGGDIPVQEWTLALVFIPQDSGSRVRVEKIIKMTPGPTRYATSHGDDIKSSYQLFLPESIKGIILEMTNLQGKRVFGDTWREIDLVDLQAYVSLLILAEVLLIAAYWYKLLQAKDSPLACLTNAQHP